MSKLNVALTIAGTDPTGGAGIMADLKSFQARNTYGMAVVTSVVAQNTTGVQSVLNLPQEIFNSQLNSVFSDIVPDAIKTGMLANKEIIETTLEFIKDTNIPYVLDPVMVATSGDKLISDESIDLLKTKLLPLATIITPNLPEAEVLVGFEIKDEDSVLKAGKYIQEKLKVKNVVIKGGHLDKDATDYLFLEDGKVEKFTSKRIDTNHTHGTGCTFAAVITAELAKGNTLYNSVKVAKEFITLAIQEAPMLGKGNGPVNHTVYRGEL